MNSHAAPVWPAKYDRETVVRLIAQVPEGNSAAILKMGYFVNRRPQPLRRPEAYILLKAAVASATPRTRRWFSLVAVQAFAELHLGPATVDAAQEDYKRLFAEAPSALAAGAGAELSAAIYEYVTLLGRAPGTEARQQEDRAAIRELNGSSPEIGEPVDPALKENVLGALRAYLILLRSHRGRPSGLPWAQAIKNTRSMACGDEVRKALADKTLPHDFMLLDTVSSVFAATSPKEAIQTLRDYRPQLDQADRRQVRLYYDRLIGLLAPDRLEDAIAAQREAIKLTGEGLGRLATLFFQAEDTAAFSAALEDLKRPEGSDADLLEVEDFLWKIVFIHPDEVRAAKPLEDLLSTYLTRRRERPLLEELKARLRLAMLQQETGRQVEALRTLALDEIQQRVPPPAWEYYKGGADQILSAQAHHRRQRKSDSAPAEEK